MKIVISGASGLIGSALSRALAAKGHSVARLVRPGGSPASRDIRWNPGAGEIDIAGLEGADAVVNLAGESIAGGRWTAARKQLICSSRIDSTRVLASALTRLSRKPGVFVSASAIGYYGNRGDELLDESSPPGADFLAETCLAWEAEASVAAEAGIRTVCPRIGIVLARQGGALAKMLTPFRLGLGGRIGSGRQWMSWIALADVVAVIRLAIDNQTLNGPVNAVAPNPARNSDFTRSLAKALHRPALLPVPSTALSFLLGEMAEALLLSSQRVTPLKLQKAGFILQYPLLEKAFVSILGE